MAISILLGKMKTETLIQNEAADYFLINSELPSIIEIAVNDMDVLDENGDRIENPSVSDLIENEYNYIVTRIYFDEYFEDYLKFKARLSGVVDGFAIYKIDFMEFSAKMQAIDID